MLPYGNEKEVEMKKQTRKLYSLFLVLTMVISLFVGGKSNLRVKAETSEVQLVDKITPGSLSLVSIVNSSKGDSYIYPWGGDGYPDVTYGDGLDVTITWKFPDGLIISPDEVFVYTLPEGISFNNVTEGGLYDEKRNQLGTYSVSKVDNRDVLRINYYDEKFCKVNDNRFGQVTLKSSITDIGGEQPEQDLTIEFPNEVDVTVHMMPSEIPSSLGISKSMKRVPSDEVPDEFGLDSIDKTHVYRTVINIKSTGNNTNVVFDDKMWPGMTLIGEPEFFKDKKGQTPVNTSEFSSYSKGLDTINAVYPSMSDGDELWVVYYVLIDRAMYSFDTANEFIKEHDPAHLYPSTGFPGKVSNKATVRSNEVTTLPDGDYPRSWGDIGTIAGAIDKWASRGHHKPEKGILNWEITLKTLMGSDYETGKLVDHIPAGLEFVKDSFIVRDVETGAEVSNAGTLDVVKNDDGTTDVTFVFSDELISTLKSSENSKYISYDTKVISQVKDKETYENTAKVYYDGDLLMERSASEDYNKVNELDKAFEYNVYSAPFIHFAISANSAALDLDPATDDLILEDTMSSSYDLVLDSVLINEKAPEEGEFTYDPTTRKMTFNLKDKVSYDITYVARVNLTPGKGKLTENNSSNEVTFYSKAPGNYRKSTDVKFNSDVFQSSGTSGSDKTLGTLNVYKVREGDNNSLLNGAEFTLSRMEKKDGATAYTVVEDDVETQTTGEGESDGLISFAGLTRGYVYKLEETKAPTNYAKDDTIRFYAFADSKISTPDTVTYGGKTYEVNKVDTDHASLDVYIENAIGNQSIKISKVDESGNPVNGATLAVYSGTTKKADWLSVYDAKELNLAPGEYTLKELSPATGFVDLGDTEIKFTVSESGTVTITNPDDIDGAAAVSKDDASLIKVKNKKITGTLKFTKTIEGLDDNDLADDINFEFYKVKANGTTEDYPVKSYKYSDFKTTGSITIGALDLGTYRVIETNTDIEGYNLLNTDAQKQVDVTVEEGHTKNNPALVFLTNTYEKKTGSIRITKTIEGPITENDKENLTFTVTDSSNKEVWSGNLGDSEKFKYNADKDIYESVLISKLDLDETYTVTETLYDITGLTEEVTYTIGPDGQESSGAVAGGITVSDEYVTEVAYKDVYKGADLRITKTIEGPITDNDKENLTFTVKDNGGQVVWSGKLGDSEKFETDDSGNYISKVITDLDFSKTYTVTETLYDVTGLTEEVTYTVDGGDSKSGAVASGIAVTTDKTTEVAFKDVYKGADLRITKTIEGPITDNDKENLTFTVKDNGGQVVWSGKLGDSEKFETDDSGNYISEVITDLDFSKTYTVTETLYDITGLEETVTYTIDGGNSANGNVTRGFSLDQNKITEVSFKDVYKAGGIQIVKTIEGPITDNDKENLTFTVTDNDNKTVWSGKLGDSEKFKYNAEKDIYESVLIENLDLSKTYTVTETLYDVTGLEEVVIYSINDEEDKAGTSATNIEVSADETAVVSFRDIYKGGSLRITKTIEGPITDNDKENLTFTVKDSDGKEVWSGRLGDEEKFTEGRDGGYESVLIEDLDLSKTYTVTETLYDITGLTEEVTYTIGGGEENKGATAEGITVSSDEAVVVAFKDVYETEEEKDDDKDDNKDDDKDVNTGDDDTDLTDKDKDKETGDSEIIKDKDDKGSDNLVTVDEVAVDSTKTTENDKTATDSTVKTGDDAGNMIGFMIIIALLSSMGIVTLIYKKKTNK